MIPGLNTTGGAKAAGSPGCVLTIAGSDPSGGAGIQADSRVIGLHGLHAATVVTALTAQGPRGVRCWEPVSTAMILAQLTTLAEEMSFRAVKTGLLPGAGLVRELGAVLRSGPARPLVVDPVVASTSGTRFLDTEGVLALKRDLLPLCTVVTPNLHELGLLTGSPVSSMAERLAGASRLAEECGCAVLAKGGHGGGPECEDLLVRPGCAPVRLSGPRIQTNNCHGTGCSLASAIACNLGRGAGLEESCFRAKAFLEDALRAGAALSWWAGRGPAVQVRSP